MKKFRLLGILFIIIIAFVIAYYFFQKKENANEIILHGNVDIRQVDLGFRVSGRLMKMFFEEGDNVKEGDLLAELDKIPYQHSVTNLQAQVEQAKANLLKLQTGNRPQEIQEARANLREKEVTYENAKQFMDRQAELVKKNYASKQTYEDAAARAKEAQAQVKTAQEALKLSLEGFRTEDIAAAKAQLNSIQSQLELAKVNLSDTALFAPSQGIILSRIVEPGTILAAGNPVYTISLTNPIWVRAYISETNLGRIKPGMDVEVFTDAYPHNPYKGQIGFISPQAEFTPKTVETTELRTDLVYRLRIVVQDPKGQLRQGMPITVNINLNQLKKKKSYE